MYKPRTKDFLDRIAQHIPFPMLWTDGEARLIGANQPAVEMMGAQKAEELLGKCPHEYLPADLADSVLAQVRLVRDSNLPHRQDEMIPVQSDGNQHCYRITRIPLGENEDEPLIVLATGVNVTAEHEVETLRRELMAVKERSETSGKPCAVQLIGKDLHELTQAVAQLQGMVPLMNRLTKSQREQFTQTVFDLDRVARGLLQMSQIDFVASDADPAEPEAQQAVLASGVLHQVFNERKADFLHLPVVIDIAIADIAQFAFIRVQPQRLKAAMIQLITNAVSALKGNPDGRIVIRLDGDTKFVTLAVQDNGKGMNFEMLDKMLNRQNLGAGNVRGVGMRLIWDMLEQNRGILNVDTILDQGTSIQLTFPRTITAEWIATSVRVMSDSIVVVLDDDPAIHAEWDRRFDIYRRIYPALQLRHYSVGAEVLDMIIQIDPAQRSRLAFLGEQTLSGQELSGLDIIEIGKVGSATLFTADYANPAIQDRGALLGVKIAPKEMVQIIPLHVDLRN